MTVTVNFIKTSDGALYLRAADVAAYLFEVAATEAPDVRSRIRKAAIKLTSRNSKEEKAT